MVTEGKNQRLYSMYSRVGFVLFGVYALATLSILFLIFPTRPRLAALLMSLWGMATLFPACVFISLGLVFSSDHRLEWHTSRIVQYLVGTRGLVVAVFVSFFAAILMIQFVFFGRSIIPDEEAYLFQAKTYLLGRIAMPVPPGAESISRSWMIMNWIWTTRYLWGHSVLLSVGMLVGSPYVSTVLMAICSLVLLYLIGIRTASKEEATIAVLLMGTSPWFWFISGTLFSNVSMLFLLILFIYGWLRLQERPRVPLGASLGLCLGWAFTVRPLTAVCFALPFAFIAITMVWKEPRKWLPPIIGLLSGGLAVMALLMFYNTLVTGDPFTFPFLYYSMTERLGFGERASGTFTPAIAMLNSAKALFLINMWLFGWPISLLPAVAIVAGHVVFRLRKNSGTRNWLNVFSNWNSWDTLWIAIMLTVCCGHFFYCWSLVVVTIPIYYYELLIPLCLLSAKGLMNFHRMFACKGSRWSLFVPVLCVASFLSSVLFFVPIRAAHLRDRYDIFKTPLEADAGQELTQKKALIFVDMRRPDLPSIQPLPWPSPRLDDKLLFVFLKDDAANEDVVRAFPDRTPYLMKSCNSQFRPQFVKRLPSDEPLNDPDIRSAARVKYFDGKIDRSQPPPATIRLLKLFNMRPDL
ncbi:MAG: glycosyltransferase family 39 protein [Desulfomonile sp.]